MGMLHIAHMSRLQGGGPPGLSKDAAYVTALSLQDGEDPVSRPVFTYHGKDADIGLEARQVDRDAPGSSRADLSAAYPQNGNRSLRRDAFDIPPDIFIEHQIANQRYAGATEVFDDSQQLRGQHDPSPSLTGQYNRLQSYLAAPKLPA
jgi:hypothetical protein